MKQIDVVISWWDAISTPPILSELNNNPIVANILFSNLLVLTLLHLIYLQRVNLHLTYQLKTIILNGLFWIRLGYFGSEHIPNRVGVTRLIPDARSDSVAGTALPAQPGLP